jgi:predicted GNAT family acetyltransferase
MLSRSVLKSEAKVKNVANVIRSRFEIEQDGQIAYLEFDTDSNGWMTLWHTEVPKGLRGKGIGLELVTNAFEYAQENSLQVDVICPLALHVVEKHPEFQALTGTR